MKIRKIIDNYCRLYGVTMPEIDYGEPQYIVTISPDGCGRFVPAKESHPALGASRGCGNEARHGAVCA